jgi:hypothetical protein
VAFMIEVHSAIERRKKEATPKLAPLLVKTE